MILFTNVMHLRVKGERFVDAQSRSYALCVEISSEYAVHILGILHPEHKE